jgi:hypothetical protein
MWSGTIIFFGIGGVCGATLAFLFGDWGILGFAIFCAIAAITAATFEWRKRIRDLRLQGHFYMDT